MDSLAKLLAWALTHKAQLVAEAGVLASLYLAIDAKYHVTPWVKEHYPRWYHAGVFVHSLAPMFWSAAQAAVGILSPALLAKLKGDKTNA